MHPTVEIRPATEGDAAHLVRLMGELGYVVAESHLREALSKTPLGDTDQVFAAIDGGEVVGCMSLHALPLFHRKGKLGRITSLVVSASQRGKGIGSALMIAAHEWFGTVGCIKFEVTSGDQRAAAHRFYQRHGYARDGQRLARTGQT